MPFLSLCSIVMRLGCHYIHIFSWHHLFIYKALPFSKMHICTSTLFLRNLTFTLNSVLSSYLHLLLLCCIWFGGSYWCCLFLPILFHLIIYWNLLLSSFWYCALFIVMRKMKIQRPWCTYQSHLKLMNLKNPGKQMEPWVVQDCHTFLFLNSLSLFCFSIFLSCGRVSFIISN